MKILRVRGHDETDERLVADLARHGFRIAAADSATTALEVIKRVRIDAIVSDYRLNRGRSGIWLLERIGELVPQTARILIAANPNIDFERLVARGVCDHAFRPTHACEAIRRVLTSARLRAAPPAPAPGVPHLITSDPTPAMGL